MDIKKNRLVKNSQGNSAAQGNQNVVERAGSWAYGNYCNANDVEAEKREQDLAFGTPHDPAPFGENNGKI